jgi:hypothetical protein
LLSHKNQSQPIRNEKLEDFSTRLNQKQQRQEKKHVSWSTETHELQKKMVDKLGNIDPDWEWGCSIARSVNVMLQC